MHTFETDRLQLRPINAGDEALYCHLYTDPEVMRHIAAPLAAEAAQRAFRTVIQRTQQPTEPISMWVLIERDMRADIGIVALMRHPSAADSAEVGAMLIAAGQGRGLAAEAQAALLDHLFGAAGLRMVWSRNSAGNVAAVRVRLKLGFVRDDADQTNDTVIRWEITADQWRAHRGIGVAMEQSFS